MKKHLVSVLLLGFCWASSHAALNSDAADYSVGWIMANGDSRQIAYVAEIVVGYAEYDDYLPSLAAERAHHELSTTSPDDKIIIWMLRILGDSRQPRFHDFLASIVEGHPSNEIGKAAQEALGRLAKQPAADAAPYMPGKMSLDALRNELERERASHKPTGSDVVVRDIKRAKTMQAVFDLLGYPDSLNVDRSWGRGAPTKILVATWDNRFSVGFSGWKFNRGRGLLALLWKDVRVSHIHELFDFSDEESVTQQLGTDDQRTLATLLKQIQRSHKIPEYALDTMGERLMAGLAAEDKRDINNLSTISILLGQSGDAKYSKLLESARTSASNEALRIKAAQGLFELYAATNNLDALRQGIDSKHPQEVRLAAKIIHSSRIFDAITLDRLSRTLVEQMHTEDRHLVDALAVMCKSLADSGQKRYLKDLETAANSGRDEKLRNFAKASAEKLQNTNTQHTL